MANQQQILDLRTLLQEVLKVLQGSCWCESIRVQNLSLVPGLRTNQGSRLKTALERTGDDQIELYIQRIEYQGKLKTVTLAILVERSFRVEQRVGTTGASTGVAKDKKIHEACR